MEKDLLDFSKHHPASKLELEKENLDRHAILFIESQIGFGLAFKLRGERGSSAIEFDTLFCDREVSQIATATERPKFRIS